jgi:hypothetical protein
MELHDDRSLLLRLAWTGRDRRDLRVDDDSEALVCPNCGHIDPVDYLPELSRRELLAIAKQRTALRRDSEGPIPLRIADSAA